MGDIIENTIVECEKPPQNTEDIIEILDQEPDQKCEEIPLSLLPDKKINIRLIFTLYSIGEVNTYSHSVKVNFHLDFLYKKKDKLKYKFTTKHNNFPFVIVNACGDCNIIREDIGEYASNTLRNFSLYANKKLVPEIDRENDGEGIIIFESYHIMAEVKVINHAHFIPFNDVYVPIHISTTGFHNTQYIYFTNSKETSFGDAWMNASEKALFFSIPICERFKKKYVRTMNVHNSVSKAQLEQAHKYETIMKIKDMDNSNNYKSNGFWWPRAYFIVKYNFTYKEDIFKYFIVPTLFNNILVGVSSLGKGEFLALFTTFCLSDIALLFTMPDTKCLTISEMSIMWGITLSLILVCIQWYSTGSLSVYLHLLPILSQIFLVFINLKRIWASKKIENDFWSKWEHPRQAINVKKEYINKSE